MMQEVEVLKTIPELVCSYFSEEQFTLSPSNQDLIDPSLTGYYTDGLAYTFFYKTTKK